MPYPFQIVQSTDTILMTYELRAPAASSRLNSKETSPAPAWMGWSIGRWDGDTFVIDVTDHMEDTWFDRAGNYHSDALKVTERYSAVDANTLQYEATIEDPKVFSRPWKIEHAALPPPRSEHAADGIQVRGVCGGADVRAPAKEARRALTSQRITGRSGSSGRGSPGESCGLSSVVRFGRHVPGRFAASRRASPSLPDLPDLPVLSYGKANACSRCPNCTTMYCLPWCM